MMWIIATLGLYLCVGFVLAEVGIHYFNQQRAKIRRPAMPASVGLAWILYMLIFWPSLVLFVAWVWWEDSSFA
jgi:hypothetical protein